MLLWLDQRFKRVLYKEEGEKRVGRQDYQGYLSNNFTIFGGICSLLKTLWSAESSYLLQSMYLSVQQLYKQAFLYFPVMSSGQSSYIDQIMLLYQSSFLHALKYYEILSIQVHYSLEHTNGALFVHRSPHPNSPVVVIHASLTHYLSV